MWCHCLHHQLHTHIYIYLDRTLSFYIIRSIEGNVKFSRTFLAFLSWIFNRSNMLNWEHKKRQHRSFSSSVAWWMKAGARVCVCVCTCVRMRGKEKEWRVRAWLWRYSNWANMAEKTLDFVFVLSICCSFSLLLLHCQCTKRSNTRFHCFSHFFSSLKVYVWIF